jgi:hypothetical protein
MHFMNLKPLINLKKNLVGNLQCHGDVSDIVMQDSVSEPAPQVFLSQSDNNLESEDETDSDYNLWEISGNQMF